MNGSRCYSKWQLLDLSCLPPAISHIPGHHNSCHHKEGLLGTGSIYNSSPSESVHAIADCVFWFYWGTAAWCLLVDEWNLLRDANKQLRVGLSPLQLTWAETAQPWHVYSGHLLFLITSKKEKEWNATGKHCNGMSQSGLGRSLGLQGYQSLPFWHSDTSMIVTWY